MSIKKMAIIITPSIILLTIRTQTLPAKRALRSYWQPVPASTRLKAAKVGQQFSTGLQHLQPINQTVPVTLKVKVVVAQQSLLRLRNQGGGALMAITEIGAIGMKMTAHALTKWAL
jgi:hypothetical protein